MSDEAQTPIDIEQAQLQKPSQSIEFIQVGDVIAAASSMHDLPIYHHRRQHSMEEQPGKAITATRSAEKLLNGKVVDFDPRDKPSNPYMNRRDVMSTFGKTILRATSTTEQDYVDMHLASLRQVMKPQFSYELVNDPDCSLRKRVQKQSLSGASLHKHCKSIQLPNQVNVMNQLMRIDRTGDKKEKQLMQSYLKPEEQRKIQIRRQISKKTQ